MKTKTCGECKHYDMHGGCNKIPNTLWIHSTNIACIKFEAKNPTNGDVIRQGGNWALAEFAFGVEISRCKFCAYLKNTKKVVCQRPNDSLCIDGVVAYLDAPAYAPDTNVGKMEE